MGDDERIEGRRQSSRREVSGDGAAEGSVGGEEEQAANAGEEACCEALKGDADVVADVEAEHHPVGIRGAAPADRLGARRIHLVERRGSFGAHH